MRKQEHARQTRAARLEPTVRALLDDAFTRLGLLDPERHIRDAIVCYPLDAIVDAIAIFSALREHRALKPSMDARYLLGIPLSRCLWPLTLGHSSEPATTRVTTRSPCLPATSHVFRPSAIPAW